ncbi:hypothetical protein P167DRAFT_580170 [Morchella conica CCBAS932]|uniref:Uncharacterized protein n=1 Tax=Morchella conica CCBAS932 TaxID=1392247 RepID=A0A3N4K827_9PEZI|nr:hypothetical protein P167DRAFT_580170 [Morchella conica CCBAS932]
MKQNNKHEHHTYYIDAAAMEYKTPPGLAKSLHSDISRESFNTIIEVINQSFIMLIRSAARTTKENAQYYYDHPRDAWDDLKNYAHNNPREFPLICAFIIGGIVVIVVPLAIGFGPVGPVLGSLAAGWQAGMGGVVVSGSAFALMQSLTMTGVFTAVGCSMIAAGLQGSLVAAATRSLSGEVSRLRVAIAGRFSRRL